MDLSRVLENKALEHYRRVGGKLTALSLLSAHAIWLPDEGPSALAKVGVGLAFLLLAAVICLIHLRSPASAFGRFERRWGFALDAALLFALVSMTGGVNSLIYFVPALALADQYDRPIEQLVAIGLLFAVVTTAGLIPGADAQPQLFAAKTVMLFGSCAFVCFVSARSRFSRLRLANANAMQEELLIRLTEKNTQMERSSDEIRRAARAKSEFLANMSHEIRTPLNGIIGMTGLLQESRLDDRQLDFVQVIRTSGDTLLSLINDILDFSKIESGKLDLEQHPFSIRECIDDALDLLGHPAREKHLELWADIGPNVPVAILGDATRVRQIIVNLVANAVKFTEAGEVGVTVRADCLPGEQVQLRFDVTDTGIGIPPDRLSTLFDAFTQADASTTRRYGGTGLGLAITRRLVEIMKGSLDVESTVGHGSTFSFTIQTSRVDREFEISSGPLIASHRAALVVDDNETGRRILVEQLETWGIATHAVASGPEALRLLQEHQFDVLITDYQMPEMDGITLARQSCKIAPNIARVMLSSLGEAPPDSNAEEVFDAWLTKPVRSKALRRSVERALFSTETTAITLAPTASGIPRPASTSMRILLAEDNRVNQKVAERMLERLGYSTDIVGDGSEAVAQLKQKRYDIILMDMDMPEMDGITATQEIRKQFPKEDQPWIIALTANAMNGDRERCLEAGMDDYLAKPVRLPDLSRAMNNAVDVIEGTITASLTRRSGSGLRRAPSFAKQPAA